MMAIGFDLRLHAAPFYKKLWIPYYELPTSDFGVESGEEGVADALTAHGIGLNWGDLVRLSKACKIGAMLLPGKWPRKFRDELLGSQHNACIQQMLWLSRFKQPQDVEIEPRPFPGCKKRPDWRFRSSAQVINLEVKYRSGDWIRRVDGSKYSPARAGPFDDIAPKFPLRHEGELNLVGLTVLAPIDTALVREADAFLERTPTIDAVFLWSEHHGEEPESVMRPAGNGFPKLFYNDGDEEDRCHIGIIRHVWRKSEERRNFKMSDMPEFIDKISAEDQNKPG
ncbi:hypothetical protein DES53_107261 [Roseimicrobium gellanilyticum]|uniref:Uncharacterized protein n=2 Tax=Roseimicrobium gellanilyticum TaxID=748857 RepID=A0A366HIK0_9BACT|nr:hypothetical protein DES53_107261 [Roseimicrobium gellanilyticum]